MAGLSKKVFLAPSSLFAFIDRGHPKHKQAEAFFRYFAQEKYMLYTDHLSVNETYKKIYSQISPALSRDFLRTIFFGNINIIYPQESEVKVAVKVLLNYTAVDLTFEQAIMAVLANKKDISQICTFDYLHNLYGLTAFYLPI